MSGAVSRTALGWLSARWFRQRWLGAAPMALIVAVGGAGTMMAVSAAERTAHAYGEYLERAEVGDLVINPSMNTREISAVIHALPGIERITSDVLFQTTLDGGDPRTRQQVDQGGGSDTYVFGSSDGRYVDMDRPILVEGRMPTGSSEAVLTIDAAEAEDLAVGDVAPLTFWPMQISDGLTPSEYEQFATEVVSPVGVESVEIVGIVRLADEVLPDDLYTHQRMLVSPDLAARYDCLPAEPAAGATLDEAKRQLLVPDCSVGYRYFSMAFADGTAGVAPALQSFGGALDERNARLASITELGDSEQVSYFTVVIEPDRERQRVERANRPIVAAAWVLALAAAAVSLALFTLALSRELRRTGDEQRQWHRLGVSGRTTATAVALPVVGAVVAGSVLAFLAGWWFDPGAMGLVAVVEPGDQRRFVGAAVWALAGIAAVTALGGSLLVWRSVRHAQSLDVTPSGRRDRRVPVTTDSPVVTVSIRSALGHRSATPVVAGVAVLVASCVAALVFGTSLSGLLDTPRSYGWPWDAAAMMGGGYGGLATDRLDQELGDDPNVTGWTVLGFVSEIKLDGDPMMTVIGFDATSALDLPLLEGELPRASDEVALGADTAADRGVAVGDAVRIGLPCPPPDPGNREQCADQPIDATVSGLVVFPSLGPLLSDRVGTGTGLLIPQSLFDRPELQHLRDQVMNLTSFIGVDLADDDPRLLADLEQRLSRLDLNGAGSGISLQEPIRPAEIIDARSTRTVPYAVAAVLGSLGVVGLTFAALASVRARRRDVAVLRALGLTDRQTRMSVRLQSLTTLVTALVIGVPAGVIGGRLLWRAFAHQLGVVPAPASPLIAVLLIAAGGAGGALAAAQVPAALATRTSPARGLRSE